MGIFRPPGKPVIVKIPRMTIEVLLFDLGKVLIDFDFERGMREFVSRTSLAREDFEAVILYPNWVRRYEHGEISTSDFLHYLREHGKLDMNLGEFHDAWSSVFLPGLIVPEQLIASLKARYPLILVSNSNESHARFAVENYPILRYFDHRIFSHEVGSMKPDSRIYEAAIAAAGKPPQALFFTDDREENIESAAKLGINAHRFQSVLNLVKALQNHGVEVGDFVPA
jgi:putative hydrolase of the HAD superfamily